MNDEKQIRLEEMDLLEKFLTGHGITGGAVPGYVQRRREAIEVDFGKPAVEAPAVVDETPATDEASTEEAASA